jgi:hypothetical protein
VQHKRLDFLARIFRDAGFPPAESRVRARLAYSLALGWHQQRLIDGTEEGDAQGARPTSGGRSRCA